MHRQGDADGQKHARHRQVAMSKAAIGQEKPEREQGKDERDPLKVNFKALANGSPAQPALRRAA